MNERLPFVIITSQRTGSTLLVKSLDASPDIFTAGEIFYEGPGIHHPEHQYPYRLWGSRVLAKSVGFFFRRKCAERHAQEFYATAGQDAKAVGFKLMVSQLRRRNYLLQTLTEAGAKFVFLVRRDTFATALSHVRARASGIYHADRVMSGLPLLQVDASISEFCDVVESCIRDKAQVYDLHREYGGLLVEYEDLIGKWDETVSLIGATLGLPGLRVRKVLQRVGDNALELRIRNLDELRRVFDRYGSS